MHNSAAGLALVAGEIAVTVTREEHHQDALARWQSIADTPARLAAELVPAPISAGKYQGQPGIEVRVDGLRVGELTYLMAQRYLPLVSTVIAAAGRPACRP